MDSEATNIRAGAIVIIAVIFIIGFVIGAIIF